MGLHTNCETNLARGQLTVQCLACPTAGRSCALARPRPRGSPRILQNIKSCGLSAPRWHESPSPTAASPDAGSAGGAAGGACRESSKTRRLSVVALRTTRRLSVVVLRTTRRVSVVVLRSTFYDQLHWRARHHGAACLATCHAQKAWHGRHHLPRDGVGGTICALAVPCVRTPARHSAHCFRMRHLRTRVCRKRACAFDPRLRAPPRRPCVGPAARSCHARAWQGAVTRPRDSSCHARRVSAGAYVG